MNSGSATSIPRTGRLIGASRYKVPNLERGLQVLELLLDHPGGLQQSEIAAQLRCSRTSVYRITMTLLEHGYLTREEETKALTLSRKLVAMGSRTLAEPALMTISVDILKNLRDLVKETALIGTIVENEVVVLEQILGSHPFKFSVDLGTRLPLHTAAPGKAILAFLPATEADRMIRGLTFTRFTERTLADATKLRRELTEVATTGYALDRGEQMTGIHCVAAPIFDRHGYPIAAVWITGPSDRVQAAGLETVGEFVSSQARVISTRLGHGLLRPSGEAIHDRADR